MFRKDSTVTDEDIDDLISRGQKKTEELSKLMDNKTEENLRGFSMEESEYTVYNFEGKLCLVLEKRNDLMKFSYWFNSVIQ